MEDEKAHKPYLLLGCSSGATVACKWLSEVSHGALESLEEAGDELLTVHLLGVTGALRKSLTTTHAIESLVGHVRAKMHRITRGRSSPTQALGWTAASGRLSEKSFRKVRGVAQAPALIEALKNFKLENVAA